MIILKNIGLLLFAGVLFQSGSIQKEEDEQPLRPNIIYILADDLGYADLSCYGQRKFSTPNIDRLAAEGMMFTQHYSGSSVCAPARSSLLTGLHTGHTPIRGNLGVEPEGQWPLPDSATTVFELLSREGYATGVFGKWGLGPPGSEGDPNHQGVDVFFGYNCQTLAHNYYPYHLWSNQQKVILEGNKGHGAEEYAPDIIHQKALGFMEDNRDKNFFMFYASTLPHAELLIPERYMAPFRGKFLPEKKYQGVDTGDNFRQGPYGSQSESHAAFVAMITHLDRQVGEILDKVVELGLEKNTLVIFSSDNGPHLEGGGDPDYFNSSGALRGRKRDLYEGGIRVPMIARWTGNISENSSSPHVSAFWDFLPTVAELVGADSLPPTDGISFLSSLLGEEQEEHHHLYWEFHEMGGRQAIRKGDWKAVKYDAKNGSKPIELYDLSKDPGETTNLAAEHPDLVEEMEQLMQSSRYPSAVFTF